MENADTRARVLVVDDDERNRRLLRAWLERRHEVEEAIDGSSALDALGRSPIDIVLLDVMMPGGSGLDVCAEIKRRTAGGAFLPVLLLTALGEQDDRNEGLRAGADDFLRKPCDRTELCLRVDAFLRIRQQDLLIRRQIDQLTELSSLKDDLVSLVVHDLRNPLTAVMSLLATARDVVDAPDVRADLDAAVVSAGRVRDTAEDLLEVRLLEEGKLVARRSRHDAREIVTKAIGALQGAARDHRVEFELRIEGDPAVCVDQRLVLRALENLIANAIRYSPAGGSVRIVVRPAPSSVELEVADSGPGVPATVRRGLFEKFGGLQAAGERVRRGYGLGLYLVKLVAQAHGGGVSVHDAPGGGALFRMRLESVQDA